MENYDYWKKQERPLYPDLEWNIPEQKQNRISIIGGNSQNFSSIIRTSEYLNNHFPIKDLQILLPDALRGKVPPLPNISFAPSTNSGSFDKSMILSAAMEADSVIIAGDLSKNSTTASAISKAVTGSSSPVIISKDAVDAVSPDANDFIDQDNITFVASMAQLQKLFRAVYYPKVLLLSMPLLPVVEALHKFTLSYPCTIVTFHQEKIIVAVDGQISTTPIKNTSYTPLSLWSGQLACKIAAMNLWNPGKKFEATTSAIMIA